MKCKICGHETIAYKHPRFEMLFHECPFCEFIFKDDTLYPDMNTEEKMYDFHQNSLEDQGYVNFLTNFVDTSVIPFIKNGDALDYGSGPTPVLSHILNHNYGFNVEIYDPIYHKGLPTKTFDLITSTEVVEHFHHPITSFKHISSLLKEGGILSIMTLLHPKDQESFFNWFYIRDVTHVGFYTPKTFDILKEIIDCDIIDTNHYRNITLKKREIACKK
ncbi:MAG: class I SAM-dependent methyltransferase [Tenericutes bacterium HGW-Tenericutes-6]|nr:MAG: class I SAM-dependent methyltransferase [Tenericutes bacterium HGW-Tenericutes-6]